MQITSILVRNHKRNSSMGQEDCLSQTKDLFTELGSLQDEYHLRFSNIIKSQNTNIVNGINDLMKEISNLQKKAFNLCKGEECIATDSKKFD